MSTLTWKDVRAKVKCITKEYDKGITYSKVEMGRYEGVNILRNNELKKWSILIIPSSRYREIMKNSYKKLAYQIKDQKEDGNTATVTAEIEVVNSGKILSSANVYIFVP